MPDLQLVDPAQNPYLSGRFAPVHREVTSSEVTVEGSVPTDLVGTYIRNGPNPKFPPLGSYQYPMEGDGMLHSVSIEPGQVSYRNRWVQTQGLQAEERAGKALFGGLMTPAFVDQTLLGPDPDPGWPSKLDAFVNIVRHADRYLALEEGMPCYEVSPALETIGRYDFAGALPKGLTAHPKIDPVTGEMVIFRYDTETPFLTWSVVGPDGVVTKSETEVKGVDRGYMIHDFAITEHHLVLGLGPAVFDIAAMLAGGPLLSWKPELGMRIAVIRRDGVGDPRWIDTDAFWVWHYGNAYDDGDTIQLHFPRWNLPGFLVPGTAAMCSYVRTALSPSRGTIDTTVLHEAISDFPRIDDRKLGHAARYVIVTAVSGAAELAPGEHDALCRVDLESGDWEQYESGGAINEAVFAPRPGGSEELDGYYLAFVNELHREHTYLGIWDAADFPQNPQAKLHLPQRVPNGLHGNWFPAVS
jgi:carotenoid cleavage dioxygenase-like enzyme